MPYTIEEHKHRFATWAAATAASASPKCRFTVEKGKRILEACNFNIDFSRTSNLPAPGSIDAIHAQWRKKIISAARKEGIENFSDGVAAKLINCYLKVRFVCGGMHNDKRVASLHPPIDSLILKRMAELDIGGFSKEWRRYSRKGWSSLSSKEYQEIIDLIRISMGDKPLWAIEEYWRGHQ